MSEVQVYDKEQILSLLARNDQAVARAILALYARQTADEQSGETTRHSNGAGFNSNDAPFLTSVAKALPRYNMRMTPRQLTVARKMLPKYWRQLLEIAAEKGHQVETKVRKAAARQLDSSIPLMGRF